MNYDNNAMQASKKRYMKIEKPEGFRDRTVSYIYNFLSKTAIYSLLALILAGIIYFYSFIARHP